MVKLLVSVSNLKCCLGTALLCNKVYIMLILYLHIITLSQLHTFSLVYSPALSLLVMYPPQSLLTCFLVISLPSNGYMHFHWYSVLPSTIFASLSSLTATIANYSHYVCSSLYWLWMQPCEAFKSCYCVHVIVFILPISVCVSHMCCTVLLCQQFLINLFMQW